MTTLVRSNGIPGLFPLWSWDPFRLMEPLLSWDPVEALRAAPWTGAESFVPPFEVRETEAGYVIQADLPGLGKKDVDVELSGRTLIVRGQRQAEQTDLDGRHHACERAFGSFMRSFTLPEEVDADHVSADLTAGVLTVELPRKGAQPRRVPLGSLLQRVKERVKETFQSRERSVRWGNRP